MRSKRSICPLDRELKFDVPVGPIIVIVSIPTTKITFTTRFPGRVDVVHLGNLLVGVLPCTISKVNVDVDTTGVIQPLFGRALRSERTRKEELQKSCVLSSLGIQTLPPAK